ncbi:hypothetical protein ACO0M4_13255 [Streptomyces sp. RGM 3693]|uniref:hypothetical protein n=1 Tax=Streptomyces sp. RGM 3693 TaxID=3413284 RepID=UPI003D2D2298
MNGPLTRGAWRATEPSPEEHLVRHERGTGQGLRAYGGRSNGPPAAFARAPAAAGHRADPTAYAERTTAAGPDATAAGRTPPPSPTSAVGPGGASTGARARTAPY